MKIQLIDDIRGAWKLLSVNAMAIGGALEAAWLGLSPDMRATMPTWLPHVIAIAFFVLGIIGRIVKQPVRTPAEPSKETPAP